MATDATGTPTSLGIPKYNTATDAPSGQGFNAAMDSIDTLIGQRVKVTGSPVSGDALVWNGSAWVPDSTLDANARVAVAKGGVLVGTRRKINLIEGSGVTLTVADDAANEEVDVTVATTSTGTLLRPSVTEVVNTSAETTFLTQTITGGSMGTNKLLRATLLGDILYNSGTPTLTLRYKFGGTTILQTQAMSSNTAQANRMPMIVEVFIQNLGAANSQLLIGTLRTTGTTIQSTTVGASSGSLLNGSEAGQFGGNTTPSSVDTAVDQALTLTAQWSAASTALSFRPRTALIEIV